MDTQNHQHNNNNNDDGMVDASSSDDNNKKKNDWSETNSEVYLPIISPATIFISGATQSGKSTLIKAIVDRSRRMFTEPVHKAVWCYSMWQPLYQRIQDEEAAATDTSRPPIVFRKGLPTEEELTELSGDGVLVDSGGKPRHTLLILDDLIHEVCSDAAMCRIFTTLSHHLNISVCLLSQTLFPSVCYGRYARTISLNSHYLILFRNRRDLSQINTLSKQLFPGRSNYFVRTFDKATNAKPYAYLLVDLSPHGEEKYQLRSNVLPGEQLIVYGPK